MTQRKFGIARAGGRSMEPTLHEGDRLLVLYGARPRRGKLAIVRLPDDASGAPRPLSVKRLSRRDPEGSDGWWIERDNPLSLIHISEPTRLGMISYAVF